MADGFIVRKGGVTTEQALAPTITEVSTTETSITFTITNNDDLTAVILYEVDDATPDANSIELATGVTSGNIEITGLAEGTAFDVYATANVTGKVKSNVTEKQISTVAVPAPTITLVSTNTTSIVFTLTNNSSQTKDVTYGLTSPPTTTTISLASGETSSNQTFSGLTDTTDFTIFAQAVNSSIAEKQAQTLIPTPTITNVSQNANGLDDASITFTVRNNSSVAANVVYDLVTPPVGTVLQLAANTTSSNQTIGGLGDDETFTIFAQTKITGFADSAIASQSVTTPEFKVFTAATGGTTQEYNSGGKRFRSHTFTSNGTFTVTNVGDATDDRNKANCLVIAGGASGGAAPNAVTVGGGGGGAGGFVVQTVTVSAGQTSVQVGGGGAAQTQQKAGNNGTNSVFSNIVALGGGAGAGGQAGESPAEDAKNGGSGGGSAGANNTKATGSTGLQPTSTSGGFGNNGGNKNQNGGSAGGGGANQIGGDNSGTTGGKGGNGRNDNLRTGSNETRAGGGGGHSVGTSPVSVGGTGGGGNGGFNLTGVGQSGTTNTGSGGGGARQQSGRGGSGIVVIRYEIAPSV